jgi:tripartite-type tricarboxylate transporter receptor subunit TctC
MDASYDLWTNNWANETMIWNEDVGDPTYWNTQGKAITINGVAYQFVNLGSENIFIMKNQEKSGSVDILAVFNWEVANGYAKATDVPTQLEYGVEIEATTGSQTFPMTGLTFNLS